MAIAVSGGGEIACSAGNFSNALERRECLRARNTFNSTKSFPPRGNEETKRRLGGEGDERKDLSRNYHLKAGFVAK